MTAGRWYRDTYRDAVWETETLTALEKAVAETYARHVRDAQGDKSPDADLAWLTYPRLMALSGIGRRANVATAVAGLVKAGWLVVHEEMSRRPTVYRLAIPLLGSSTIGTTGAGLEVIGGSDGGTTVVPVSGSSSSDGGTTVVHHRNHRSSDGGTPPVLKNLRTTPSSSSRPVAIERIIAAGAVDEDEATAVLKKIQSENTIRKSLGAYVAGISDADLREHLDALRGLTGATRNAQLLSEARAGPVCIHDMPGGANPHPITDEPICPMCRIAARRTA